MIEIFVPATSANCSVGFDSLGLALDWNARFLFEKREDEAVDRPLRLHVFQTGTGRSSPEPDQESQSRPSSWRLWRGQKFQSCIMFSIKEDTSSFI